jgi:hypothetical protein
MGFGGLALSVRFAASKVFILSELEGKFGSFGKIRLEKPAATPNEISGAFPNRLFSILTFQTEVYHGDRLKAAGTPAK